MIHQRKRGYVFMKRNIRKIIDSGKVNQRYDISLPETEYLINDMCEKLRYNKQSKWALYELVHNSFIYGYMLGMRAAKHQKNKGTNKH